MGGQGTGPRRCCHNGQSAAAAQCRKYLMSKRSPYVCSLLRNDNTQVNSNFLRKKMSSMSKPTMREHDTLRLAGGSRCKYHLRQVIHVREYHVLLSVHVPVSASTDRNLLHFNSQRHVYHNESHTRFAHQSLLALRRGAGVNCHPGSARTQHRQDRNHSSLCVHNAQANKIAGTDAGLAQRSHAAPDALVQLGVGYAGTRGYQRHSGRHLFGDASELHHD
mmetsp:Transcript_40928/g.92282  ORF Transcript_40928/g.92282 Transcript_40928/m.92282 type:complete len:220 (-) Transcript_40928:336-995(-)